MSVRTELPKPKADLKSTTLRAVVKGKGKGERQWKAVADLISVSSTGSSFNLGRRCEPGTLISLMIPLPAHLRCYDYDKELYRVWGLVQHCEQMSADNASNFYVGVAFIGKNCPDSYKDDPQQHYRISGVGGDGMWSVDELKTPFKKRAEVRFWKQIELYLALIDTKNGLAGGEKTVAENVSRGGAAVITTLNVGMGDRVKFISAEYDFSGLAVVCNAQVAGDNKTKLHLKFVESTFPVKTLMKSDVVVERI